MTRSRRAAAVSAVFMSLGLCGAVVFASGPFTAPNSADAAQMAAVNPTEIPGCDVDPAGPCEEVTEEPNPVVTVTVTADTSPPVPQKTVTTTVTVPPATSPAKPKPKPPKVKPPKVTVPETSAPVVVPLPTSAPVIQPSAVVPEPTPTEQDPVFPSTEQVPSQLSTAPAEPTSAATFDDPTAASVPYEIRNAGSGFNAPELSRQLGIPALILVLLVLFGVLIFEGRLRRLAHASAVRRAGPRAPGQRDFVDPMGYPAGPGYVPAPGFPPTVYQNGTAYAPIISFVPMQMYPATPEDYSPERYPQSYEQPTAYIPGQDDAPHSSTGPFPRSPEGFPGAAFPQEPPRSDDQGAEPFDYFGDRSRTAAQERPGLRDGGVAQQGFGEFPGAPFPQEPPRGGQGLFAARGRSGSEAPFSEPQSSPSGGAELNETAVYPLPGQKDGKRKRGLFRRSR